MELRRKDVYRQLPAIQMIESKGRTAMTSGRNLKQSFTLVGLTILTIFTISGPARAQASKPAVVVYTSVDQVFSEPVLKRFEKEKGIAVKAVYDVEASKTTGLVNRLLAEKQRPKCDVFWNSEFARTILLKRQGLLAAYDSPSASDIPSLFRDRDRCWTGFSARARVFVYNRNLLREGDVPPSIFDLASPAWKGRVALAYPLFGTTATQMAALYVALGKDKAESYLKALQGNGVVLVDGNAVVRDLVVEGRLPLGLTDTDDVSVAIGAGKPVGMVFPDKGGLGTLLIPNTVALVRGGPHPETGKILIDYLLSHRVESLLAFSEAAQIPVRAAVERPAGVPDPSSFTAMAVDYEAVARAMDEAARFCQSLFVR